MEVLAFVAFPAVDVLDTVLVGGLACITPSSIRTYAKPDGVLPAYLHPPLSVHHGSSSPPTRSKARKVTATVTILCLALVTFLCLVPVAVKVDDADDRRAEYGTVIVIGELTVFSALSTDCS